MTEGWVCLDDLFDEVREYVRVGLPSDHFLRDDEKGEEEREWLNERDYLNYPPHVLEAARFRDGLVLDGDVYSKFNEDFCYSYWADEYKKQSAIVFNYVCTDPFIMCPTGAHTNNGVLCGTIIKDISLMNFHISHVEGTQSQSLMRDKVMSLLRADIMNLPKTASKKEPTAKTKAKYLHALGVVLFTMALQEDWLLWKVYGFENFEVVVDATLRVNNVLCMLIKWLYFDTQSLGKLFLRLCKYIKIIDAMNDTLVGMCVDDGFHDPAKRRFFKPSWLVKYSDHATFLKDRHADIEKQEEDDDNGNDDDKEEEEEEEAPAQEGGGGKRKRANG